MTRPEAERLVDKMQAAWSHDRLGDRREEYIEALMELDAEIAEVTVNELIENAHRQHSVTVLGGTTL